jgi:hypothetical protein
VPFTAPPEPTGVPGLNAADQFCAAWVAYSASVQALGVAASFGDLSSEQLAVLELVAAPRLVAAVDEITASWPEELTAERAVVVESRLGPYFRRALSAVAAITATGVAEPGLEALREAWQSALESRDPESPVIDIPDIAPELRAQIDTAATAYDNAVTPFAQDPSLSVEGIDTPVTDAYLATRCPDLAASGVGDSL